MKGEEVWETPWGRRRVSGGDISRIRDSESAVKTVVGK
jgi:hypothetical protein